MINDSCMMIFMLMLMLLLVPGGHRAVIFDRFQGVMKDVIGEGTHFLVPWLQKAIIYDTRVKPRNISTTTGSKGTQEFVIGITCGEYE